METMITPEERHEMFAWLRGGDLSSDPQMEDRFINTIAVLVQARIDEKHPQADRQPVRQEWPRPLSINAIMREVAADAGYNLPQNTLSVAKPESKPEPVAEEKESAAEGIDSVVIARTIVHISREQGHRINMTQLQAMLYIMYGIYLCQKGQRLIQEHPQMWEYGPVFPRAYNKLRKEDSDGRSESDSLNADHPDIWKFISDSFSRYAWTTGSVLVAPHVATGSPWAKTRKTSPDKWGAVIDDKLIEEWFAKRMA